MIPIKEVGQIHKLLIYTFEGSHGIRDLPALESAFGQTISNFR